MVLVRSMAIGHGRTFQGVEKVINWGSIFGVSLLTAMVILVGVTTGVIAIGLVGLVMDMTIHGGNSGTSRVGDFSRNFKNQFSAIRASPEADLFRFIKLTLVSLDAETRAEGTTIVVSIGSHFAAFEEAFQNWVLSKYRGGSAAWASHGFGFCHWRNV